MIGVQGARSNIVDEIYTRRQYKNTKRYDTRKPPSMIRAPNNQLPQST